MWLSARAGGIVEGGREREREREKWGGGGMGPYVPPTHTIEVFNFRIGGIVWLYYDACIIMCLKLCIAYNNIKNIFTNPCTVCI